WLRRFREEGRAGEGNGFRFLLRIAASEDVEGAGRRTELADPPVGFRQRRDLAVRVYKFGQQGWPAVFVDGRFFQLAAFRRQRRSLRLQRGEFCFHFWRGNRALAVVDAR